MKMYELRKIDVLSFAKIMSLLMGTAGFFSAAISFMTWGGIAQNFDFLAFASPLMMAAMGFITGAVQAILINVLTKYTNGIKFTVSELPTVEDQTD